MRVLDLNNNYSPVGGGVKTYHHKKLEYFASREGLTNALMVPDDHDAIEPQPGGNVLYRVAAPPLGKGSGYRLAVSVKRLRAVVSDFKPDIIEMGSVWALPWLMKRINQQNIPTVGFYHTDVPNTHVAVALKHAPRWLKKGPIEKTYDLMAKIFSPLTATFGASEYVLRRLEKHGVQRLFHTPFGADTSVFRPSDRSASLRTSWGADSKRLALYLSRINAEKGVDLLMDAYPHARDPENFQLVIGGHGPGEARLQAFLKEYPEVYRLDYLHDRSAVAAAFATADVFLSLGAAETFGLAVTEAMSCGTPVVAPLAGGAGEQVDRAPFGYTFEPGNALALADVLKRFTAASDAQREHLHRYIVDHHDWSRTFDRMVSCYQQVIDAHASNELSSLDGVHRI